MSPEKRPRTSCERILALGGYNWPYVLPRALIVRDAGVHPREIPEVRFLIKVADRIEERPGQKMRTVSLD